MDATRISDGATVALKKVASQSSELAFLQLFSSSELKDRPSNHCVPLYDVLPLLDDPDVSIIVMPYLVRFHTPAFETVGEVVDFFLQIFEVLICKPPIHIFGHNVLFPGFAFHACATHCSSVGGSPIAYVPLSSCYQGLLPEQRYDGSFSHLY